MLYEYPKKTKFGKMVAKSKIYEYANASTALKDKFKTQIDKITWSYKLATETLNLDSSEAVPEIQVLDIRLKEKELSEELLRVIDKVISFPIIFQLHYDEKTKVKAAYKRPSDVDKNKWVIESYFESEWIDNSSDKQPLPVALNLSKLYELFIHSLMPKNLEVFTDNASIKEKVDKIKLYKEKEKEYEKLKARRDKEKQFNHKAELNKQLKNIKLELNNLQVKQG